MPAGMLRSASLKASLCLHCTFVGKMLARPLLSSATKPVARSYSGLQSNEAIQEMSRPAQHN
jgi:hypothetical protein